MSKTRPLREGLFTEGPPPALLGSRCRETGELFYPAQVMNPVTHRAGTMEPAELPSTGTLINYTKIIRPAPGFEAPYAIGIVQLDGGPTLTAQLADWQDKQLHTGMGVELVIGIINRDREGVEVMGPKFRPIEEPKAKEDR